MAFRAAAAIELIHSSENSLKDLISNSKLTNLNEYLKNSRAILIFPELYEGGLKVPFVMHCNGIIHFCFAESYTNFISR